MLVDLPYGWDAHRDPLAAIMTGPDYKPEHVALGVYQAHSNFGYDIGSYVLEEYPFEFHTTYDRHKMTEEAWDEAFRNWDWANDPNSYGVCDRWEQIIERWPIIFTSERRFIISLTEMRREHQSPTGGWRWHKWGKYIGEHDPQHEYLYDEDPSIEAVQCFHVFEVK